MNNDFQQMWAEIKNLWNHALICVTNSTGQEEKPVFSFSTLLCFDFVFVCFPVVLFDSLVALLKRMNGHFFSFSSPENVEKVGGLLQRKAGLGPQWFSLTVPRR